MVDGLYPGGIEFSCIVMECIIYVVDNLQVHNNVMHLISHPCKELKLFNQTSCDQEWLLIGNYIYMIYFQKTASFFTLRMVDQAKE